MFVIINSGVCCHYQIEGGVFTTRELAEQFAVDRVDKYTTLDQLKVVEVKVDPAVADFPTKDWNPADKETSIWW